MLVTTIKTYLLIGREGSRKIEERSNDKMKHSWTGFSVNWREVVNVVACFAGWRISFLSLRTFYVLEKAMHFGKSYHFKLTSSGLLRFWQKYIDKSGSLNGFKGTCSETQSGRASARQWKINSMPKNSILGSCTRIGTEICSHEREFQQSRICAIMQ